MTKHYDITLVGDGAVALVLLEFLLHFGVDKKHSIAWICPNSNNTSRASEEKRLFSLSVQSIDLLKHSGVYDKLGSFEEVRVEQLNIQYAHRHLQAWDAARQDALHQDVAFFSQLIPHAAFFQLAETCAKAVDTYPQFYQSIDFLKKSLVLQDGSRISSKLFIAVDGFHSRFCSLLGNSLEPDFKYLQKAWIATSKQVIDEPELIAIFEGGHLARLKAYGGQQQYIACLPDNAYWEYADNRLKCINSLLSSPLEALDWQANYPLSERIISNPSTPGCILMGLAAHNFHPFGGLHFNYNLGASFYLAYCLSEVSGGMADWDWLADFEAFRESELKKLLGLFRALRLVQKIPQGLLEKTASQVAGVFASLKNIEQHFPLVDFTKLFSFLWQISPELQQAKSQKSMSIYA